MVLAWKLFKDRQHVIFTEKGFGLTPYIIAITLLTLLTFVYTAIGGIKAVIWTDLIQATLMFGSAIIAIGTILYHIGGNSFNLMNGIHKLVQVVPEMKHHEGYFLFGWEANTIHAYMSDHHITAMGWWDYVRMIFASEFTLFSATIGAILGNMAAFGTDQDLVQRLLTAETYKKSRRSLITAACMDLPIAAGFSFIGVLLIVYFKENPTHMPPSNADVFGAYILSVMPVGIRGLVLAGVFATAMGSLSTALNALATSFTNDWYIPYFSRHRNEAHHVAAARLFTAIFAILMIIIAVGSAYVKVKNSEFRIIPFVIGIAGLFLGPMLGVFLIGMFTKSRGSDTGNIIAISIGLVAMIFISGQHVELANMFIGTHAGYKYVVPEWFPTVAWTWYAMFGGLIVFAIGVFFRTPDVILEKAKLRAAQAASGNDIPIALRSDS
jgi:Na+/proline symporter